MEVKMSEIKESLIEKAKGYFGNNITSAIRAINAGADPKELSHDLNFIVNVKKDGVVEHQFWFNDEEFSTHMVML